MLTAPATNDRGPRYMERALAASHQANQGRVPITLQYGSHEGRVALFLRMPQPIKELVIGPVAANYPNCHIKEVEQEEGSPAGREAWSAELELEPELFPILRHAQFEDLLNGNFADPINSVLRAIKSDEHLHCRIEIVVSPAAAKRFRNANRAVQRLDREFFRHHHRFAHFYARHATKRRGRFIARVLGLLAAGSAAPARTTLGTSASRIHDREDDLQAASEKIGAHLFETRIRLSVQASSPLRSLLRDRHAQHFLADAELIRDYADALAQAVSKEARSEPERCFLLTELCLDLARVHPQVAPGSLSKSRVTKALQELIREIRTEISPEALATEPAMAAYTKSAFEEVVG